MLRFRATRCVLAISSAILATGCGNVKLTDRENAPLTQQLRGDDAFADKYFVADLGCQASQAGTEPVAAVGTQSIFQWQGDHTGATDFEFHGTSSAPSLKSSAIQASFYNFHQQQECPADAQTTAECNGAVKTVGAEAPLKICDAARQYPRVSVEGVALTSLANLNNAQDFYGTIPGASAAILSSYLLVLPTIEKVIKDPRTGEVTKRAVSTDNLAYAANYGGSPVFVVFPKGKKSQEQGLWQGLNLWEIPWGLAHEFGHHVFRTHTGIVKLKQTSARAARDESGLAGFMPIHSYPTEGDFDGESSGFGLVGRDVGGEDVYNAVNEGYADLFAYYVYGGQAGLTKNVSCFEQNRDVADGAYANGRLKVLDQDALDTFYSVETLAAPPCTEPNLQDIHAIGAIFAYGVNQLFETKAPGDARAKAALLLKWAQGIGQIAQNGDTMALDFGKMVNEALKVVATGSGSSPMLSGAACAVVKERFPTFAPDLLTKTYTCK